MAMAASSVINKPFTSLCNSKSEFPQEIPYLRRVPFRVNSLSFKNINCAASILQVKRTKASSSISCKAVIQQQPETQIEGLNIADDVTQISSDEAIETAKQVALQEGLLVMGHEKRPTAMQVVRKLISEDGWTGFYRGLGPRFFSMSAWGTSMILAYEYLKRLCARDE